MSDDVIGFSFLVESETPVWYLKAGETVFKEGDSAAELYVIRKGQVGIQQGNRLLDTLEENDIFGEMALIDPAPRSATAIATTDVALVPISNHGILLGSSVGICAHRLPLLALSKWWLSSVTDKRLRMTVVSNLRRLVRMHVHHARWTSH